MSPKSATPYASKMAREVASAALGSGPVKLSVPPSDQGFPLFSLLPPELRFQIWEEAMTTPGMHFLRLEEDVDEEGHSGHGNRDRLESSGGQSAQPDEARITAEVHAEGSAAAGTAPGGALDGVAQRDPGSTVPAAATGDVAAASTPTGAAGSDFTPAMPAADVSAPPNGVSSTANTPAAPSSSSKDHKKAVYPARLAPRFPLLEADTSYYVTLAKILAQLACSCNEAQRVVERALAKSSALRFAPSSVLPSSTSISRNGFSEPKPAISAVVEPSGASSASISSTPFMGHEIGAGQGRLISLNPELDVICIEYLNDVDYACEHSVLPWHRPWQQPNPAGTDGTVTKTTKRELQCAELAAVRRLAVKYCRSWDAERRRLCQNCGFRHDVRRQRYPHHLLKFLEEFPNLEVLYFIDDTIRRQSVAGQCGDNKADSPPCARTAAPPGADASSSEAQASVSSHPAPVPTTSGNKTSRGGYLPYFQGGGKTYYDITDAPPADWVVESNVRLTMTWIREEFVNPGSTNPFAGGSLDAKPVVQAKVRKHPNPARVQFRVLACEFRTEDPPIPVSHLRKAGNPAKASGPLASSGLGLAGKKARGRFGKTHNMTAGQMQLRDYVSRRKAVEELPLRRRRWDSVVVGPAGSPTMPVMFGGNGEDRTKFEFGITFVDNAN